MKKIFMFVPLIALAACGPKESSSASSAETGQGKEVGAPPAAEEIAPEVAAFAKELKGALVAAMMNGGPANAISVCREKAPELAAAHSKRTGWTIRRSALRLRNPKNAPDAWERKVLEDFEKQIADGADPSSLTAYEVVGGQARFAKAIPTGKPCLTCHGPNVSLQVREALQELYPEDQATGFEPGQLRGIFSVTAPAVK